MRAALPLLLTLAACRPGGGPDALPDWVGVTVHPCAVNALGEVTCWRDEALDVFGPVPDLYREPAGAVALVSDTPWQLRGLGESGEAMSLGCTLRAPESCGLPAVPLRSLTMWGGLTPDGTLVRNAPLEHVAPPERRFQVAAVDAVVAADGREQVHFRDGAQGWVQVPRGGASQAVAVVADVGPERRSACVLDIAGEVHCVGLDDAGWPGMEFDDAPYTHLVGTRGAVCAVGASEEVRCNDGTTHRLGAVRALAATRLPSLEADGGYRPLTANPVSLCAITEANAIRCVGPWYSEAVLEQMDRELGQ